MYIFVKIHVIRNCNNQYMRMLLILLFVSNFCFGQYLGGQEINEANLSSWETKFEVEYTGIYHFGESESESDFHLFFSGDYIIGQIITGYWEKNTGAWKNKYITLTNIKIDKVGKFSSDQHTGKFIMYKNTSGKIFKGLKIDNPWTGWIENSKFEIGTRTKLNFKNIYAGKYGRASFVKLSANELQYMNSTALKIMRNEIFARYGYTFIKNGKMDIYFRKQDWYRPQHKNVTPFLTEIEIYNINLIKGLE